MTFIFLFGNCQNSFSRGPLFGPFWSVKYFPFEQKLPIRTVHHIFLGSRHPEVTKNWYYLCPPRGAKKKISAHGPQELRMELSEMGKDMKKKHSLSSPPTTHGGTFFVQKLCMEEQTFLGKLMGGCFIWWLMIRSCKGGGSEKITLQNRELNLKNTFCTLFSWAWRFHIKSSFIKKK